MDLVRCQFLQLELVHLWKGNAKCVAFVETYPYACTYHLNILLYENVNCGPIMGPDPQLENHCRSRQYWDLKIMINLLSDRLKIWEIYGKIIETGRIASIATDPIFQRNVQRSDFVDELTVRS